MSFVSSARIAAPLGCVALLLLAAGAVAQPLEVHSVDPQAGTTAGGETVVVHGTGFVETGTTTVEFGGALATGVQVIEPASSDDPLQIVCVTPAHAAGVVDVTVTNPDDASATLADGFTFLSHQIVVQPQGGVKYIGESHTFSVTASGGTPPYTYRWQHQSGGGSFEDISGAIASSYSINPLGLEDDGQYRCIVGDQSGLTLPSEIAQLSVYAHLSVVTSPTSEDRYVGTSVSFSVTVSGGKPTVMYQWQKDFADIEGATSATYTIPAVTMDNTGVYRCVVHDSGTDAVASSGAALVVFQLRVDPNQGSTLGGTPVVISGIFIIGAPNVTSVKFGLTAATDILYVDEHTITCTTPSHGAGAVDVTITNPTMAPNPTQTFASGFTFAEFFFTQEPESADKYTDGSHTFAVAVEGGTGPGTYTYQWQKANGAAWDDVGTDADTLTLGPPLALSDAGTYRCIVNDTAKSELISEEATLTVSDHLAITADPTADAFYYAGQSHAFTVETSGGMGTIHYQWRKNGTGSSADIPGANAASYVINPLTTGDSGDVYRCYTWDNGGDTALSGAAPALEVWMPVTITTQPEGGQYYEGATHTFVAAAVGGRGGTLNFQWQKYDGSDWQDLAGKITVQLGIAPLTIANSGLYRCRINDLKTPAGTDEKTTNEVQLTVATHLAVDTQPSAAPWYYAGATHTLTVSTTGGLGTIHYQWQIYVDPSWEDLPGANAASLEFNPLEAGDSGVYQCHVWDDGVDSFDTDSVTLTVVPIVFIETSPETGWGYLGDDFTFTVGASGGYGTLHYQWQKSTNPGWTSVGSDEASLFLNSLALTDEGTYRCVVSDDDTGMALSGTATLTLYPHVEIGTQPTGGYYHEDDSHTFVVSASGGKGTLHYQWQRQNGASWLDLLGATTASYELSPLHSGDSGTYRCTVSDDGTDQVPSNEVVLSVAAPLNLDQVSPNAGMVSGGTPVTLTTTDGTGFMVYGITHVTFDGIEATDVDVVDAGTLTCTTPAHAAGPVDVTVLNPDAVTTDTLAGGYTYLNFMITTQPEGGVVYTGGSHTFTVTVDSSVALDYAWEQNLDSAPGWMPIAGEISSSLAISPLATTHTGLYRCQVSDHFGHTTASEAAQLMVYDHLSISGDPEPATRYVGESATFTVSTLGGKPPLHYAWRRNGLPTSSPNEASWTISSVQMSNAGVYACIVTDADTDSATSATALLSVAYPISITQQPLGDRVHVGDSYTFTIAATGGFGPLHYQWRKDNQPIDGAESATLTLTEIGIEHAGKYSCEVSDTGTSKLSDEVDLEVTYGMPVASVTGLALLWVGTALAGAAALRRKR